MHQRAWKSGVRNRSLLSVPLFVCTHLLLSSSLLSQETAKVAGHVVKPGSDSMVVVPNTWVTLHRVGTDAAGPLDSVKTSATGAYQFIYRRTGASDAVYFASSSYGGVAYFTQPLHPGAVTGDDANIAVFDTTSHTVPITIRGRHLIVTAPHDGDLRRVTEVFELSNDSSVTRVANGDAIANAVWTGILPAAAHAPAVTQGDVPTAAMRFGEGKVAMYAPFAPGLKQLAYQYELRSDAFPLSVPMERSATVLELLVEEPTAHVTGAKLRAVEPVSIQGHRFRRYLATDVPASAVMRIDLPAPPASLNPWYVAGLVLIVGGVMTAVLARAVRKR